MPKLSIHKYLHIFLLASSFISLGNGIVYAQSNVKSYPNRQITLYVPFPPGGATDLMARTIGQRIFKKWGQSVVIENKPGAGGMLAASQVAKASPDGYSLFFGASAQLAVNQSIYSKMSYDAQKDFAPIILVGGVPNVLVANPSAPFKTLAELIQYARANPGALNYASPGSGSTAHLTAELFKTQSGIDIVHIPYKGAAGAVTDIIGGQVPLMFVSMPSVMEHVKTGKLIGLGVAGSVRSSALPDVPAFAETFPNFESTSWYGLVAPIQTPIGVITLLNNEINSMLSDPEVRKIFEDQGIRIYGGTPAQFSAHIKSEASKWAKVVQKANVKAD
jgi:tripartite-type tricarboxylate transporter receptor subunit TctC